MDKDSLKDKVLFVTGEPNDFINGENVTLDGGMTKKMIYLE